MGQSSRRDLTGRASAVGTPLRDGGLLPCVIRSRYAKDREIGNLIGSGKVEGTPVYRPDGNKVGDAEGRADFKSIANTVHGVGI
jgi:hypothetical protein